MAEVVVENPLNVVPPHKRQSPSNSIPNIDSLEGVGNDDSDEYSTLKRLQRHLECGTTPISWTTILLNLLPQIHQPARGVHQGWAKVKWRAITNIVPRSFPNVSSEVLNVNLFEPRKKSNGFRVCLLWSASLWKQSIKSIHSQSYRMIHTDD